MSNQSQHTWNESNIVDDVAFQEQDAELFKSLLNNDAQSSKEAAPTPISGTILKGRIVEITKDHVVIDVGLKSEGLVPMQNFPTLQSLFSTAKLKFCSISQKMTMARLSFHAKKQNDSASGNTSSSIAKKVRSSKGASCAKSKAA